MTLPSMDCPGADFRQLSIEVLGRGGSLRFQARGYSMAPFIRDGEIIEIAPSSGLDLRIGDVAFYWTSSGDPRAHRVIKKWVEDGTTWLQTRGDGCIDADGLVPAERVIGMVAAVYRDGTCRRLDRGLLRIGGLFWSTAFWVRVRVVPRLVQAKRRILSFIRNFPQ
jgi:hypothetical protein